MAGGKQNSVGFGAVLVACLAATLIQTSLAATSHTVGGNSGWTIAPSTPYSTWASQQTFKVGDSLVFNFQTGAHTVAEVSKSDYDACSTSNPISTSSTGPTTLTIASAGNHYYICTVTGHCSGGQKLAITATGSSSAAPSSSPTSSPAPSAATPSSSPSPATATAPTPSTSGTSPSPTTSPVPSAESPSGGTTAPAPSSATAPTPSTSGTSPSPTTSTVPSAESPSGGTTAPAPSSATVAGAGLVLPFMMIAAAFCV